MKQSKLESFIEASMNTLSGFFISLAVWMFIVTPLWNIQVSHSDNVIITVIFTVTSIIRSYVVRRFFNAGMHHAAQQLAAKVIDWRIKK